MSLFHRDHAGSPGDIVREGERVALRRHRPSDCADFMTWYGDPEIAELLRHDLRPLAPQHARNYFMSIVLPASAAGTAWAIVERASGNLLGTTAVTDISLSRSSCLFRIVIGEKQAWGHGFGSEATRLVVDEVFKTLDVTTIRLEVFLHNPRAIRAYEKVGFREVKRSVEWAGSTRLDVVEMHLTRPVE